MSKKIKPIPSIPTNYGDGVASDQTDMVGAEALLLELAGIDHEWIAELPTTYRNILKAMHRFASIHVEKVRKELEGEIEANEIASTAIINMKQAHIEAYQRELSTAQKRIAELEEVNRGNNFLLNEIDSWFAFNNQPSIKEIASMRKSIQEKLK